MLPNRNPCRMNEAELNNESARFAGTFVEKHFKSGAETEKQLVMNCVAHGFYMGARHYEKTVGRFRFWSFLRGVEPLSAEKLYRESQKASRYYVKKKGYRKLNIHEQALICATVSTGFEGGYQWRGK